ncbi:MAG: hypothetical protein K0R18_1630 [Bacillales bacterium]|nr:hypothetical protein [Bacillales bacterium]
MKKIILVPLLAIAFATILILPSQSNDDHLVKKPLVRKTEQEVKKKATKKTEEPSIYLKQQTAVTCTLSSVAMVIRELNKQNDDPNWMETTEETIESAAWASGAGLRWYFTYNGIEFARKALTGNKKEILISLLKSHPEGIVIHDRDFPHAVLLTDYDQKNDIFYIGDPSPKVPKGRLQLVKGRVEGVNQDEIINQFDAYWIIVSNIKK